MDLTTPAGVASIRLSTGGGFSTRTLYENEEEAIFAGQRPVILNAIEEVATRADLLDRAVLITCPTIDDDQRQTEESFWRQFEEVRPRILGALLSAVSAGLRNLPSIKLDQLPRMADFCKWVVACEAGLGLAKDKSLFAYLQNVKHANATALDASTITAPLMQLLDERNGQWTGTASELLEQLSTRAGEATTRSKFWPKQPHFLTGKLNRLAPNLRKVGVELEFTHSNKARTIDYGSSRFFSGYFSQFWQHAGEDFQAEVLLISETIGPPLNGPDLVVDTFHEAGKPIEVVEELEFGHRASMTSFLPEGKTVFLGQNWGFVASQAGSYPLKNAKSRKKFTG